ncbi:glycoside hydrolase family 53 protein [Robertkochia solimangrovi]|uniref:glycoside hydrolase family 53 protein n=1 Tax=Robertkochia solimangrovi TaxID=2213046 RepID=UPI00117C7106|nr:arabinogalactan endo-1,4-beta-galactosidase [Robertkochia solimangrovi]TRZ44289.1 arabinogalactan endo-1,4-beta-galactosidase [Robertkochia solimangrovi]
MKTMRLLILFFSTILLSHCSNNEQPSTPDEGEEPETETPVEENEKPDFYYGADLSYVNEMVDCGAEYKDQDGVVKDPYKIFAEAGTNLVRVRLWNNPDWTEYSNLDDVKRTIRKAKEENMNVLLDFHYSDSWADPEKQEIPKAWESNIDDTEALGNQLYEYTYSTLKTLNDEGLLPEMVQVGNEINGMILQKGELEWPINWERNASLINKGLKAVRDISEELDTDIEVMLHIAQPENALWWFEQATENGVTNYDWIGLSYYPLWSEYDLNNVGTPLKTLVDTYQKRLMIVETAYPFTMENADGANNILDNNALINGYPASPQGQLDYMNKLKEIVATSGGEGLIYWEPAWVSTDCSTLWGQGSHWDNATMFDFNNQATIGLNYYNAAKDN